MLCNLLCFSQDLPLSMLTFRVMYPLGRELHIFKQFNMHMKCEIMLNSDLKASNNVETNYTFVIINFCIKSKGLEKAVQLMKEVIESGILEHICKNHVLVSPQKFLAIMLPLASIFNAFIEDSYITCYPCGKLFPCSRC